MRRVAMLTTWKENCGVAHYSYFLKKALDRRFHVTVIPTERKILLANDTKADMLAAAKRVDEIAYELRRGKFDAVIMHVEPGIYGRDMRRVSERCRCIIEAIDCNLVLCFHSVNREKPPTLLGYLRAARHGLRPLLWNGLATARAGHWRRLYRTMNRHARKAAITAFVHTERDARALRDVLPDVTIVDSPLCYMDESYIADLPQFAKTSKLQKLVPHPPPETRYIGCFGFFAEYKGFETAVQSLEFLPDNYELLFFSGVHETSLAPGQGRSDYLTMLMSLVEDKERERTAAGKMSRPPRRRLRDRVRFVGTVSDHDLLIGMKLCDAVIVPYWNGIHSGSGPASLAVELDCLTLVSRNTQFVEFSKYFPDNFEFVDIGNYIEIAQKILSLASGYTEREVEGLRWIDYPKKHRAVNIDTNLELYTRALLAERRSALTIAAKPEIVAGE